MSAIEGVVAYQGWSLRGVPLYTCTNPDAGAHDMSTVVSPNRRSREFICMITSFSGSGKTSVNGFRWSS